MRPGDEAVIHEQIEEAETTVAREVAEFEARYPPEAFVREDLEPISTSKDDQAVERPETTEQQPESTTETPQTSAPETNSHQGQDSAEATSLPAPLANGAESAKADVAASSGEADTADQEQADAHRAAEDDGGEVVEDNEDTVIY